MQQLFFLFFSILAILINSDVYAGKKKNTVLPGEADTTTYYKELSNKRIGLIINQSSTYNDTFLIDRLFRNRFAVTKIFVPEHGFRGKEDAGSEFGNTTDKKTGLTITSLYGKHKKPTNEDLNDIDILVYDLQDVGVRFYTYISTLQYCMEACAENHKPLLILDKINPNGFYVDGPVLDTQYKSFVGMQPIPVVYGMTPGEYARMLKGEKWIKNADDLELTVVPCTNYDHTMKEEGYLPPSPNLRTYAAILAYPSLCFFEGTKISVGRGTDSPFMQYGAPELEGNFKFNFTPISKQGASSPPFEHKKCYGEFVGKDKNSVLKITKNSLYIDWLLNAYKYYPDKEHFFNNFFLKLSGTKNLEEQIKKGLSSDEIKASWSNEINQFKLIRKKYLLYKDFE